MKNNVVVSATCVLIGAAAVTNMIALFSNIPAFHRLSRQEGVFGTWRITFNTAMYDRAEYLYELGSDYMSADTIASSATEGQDEIATLDEAFERADRAVALLEESVSLNPADAYTWAGLAWGYSMQGEIPAARDAMMKSWERAPNNSGLSTTRLQFMELLLEESSEFLEIPVTEAEYNASKRDFCIASRQHRTELAEILEISPELSELFGEYDLTNCDNLS